eukprot:scaffold28204_cov65-Phaeocystis_antarctica.AAC.2
MRRRGPPSPTSPSATSTCRGRSRAGPGATCSITRAERRRGSPRLLARSRATTTERRAARQLYSVSRVRPRGAGALAAGLHARSIISSDFWVVRGRPLDCHRRRLLRTRTRVIAIA